MTIKRIMIKFDIKIKLNQIINDKIKKVQNKKKQQSKDKRLHLI
jgi:hypothetical protein